MLSQIAPILSLIAKAGPFARFILLSTVIFSIISIAVIIYRVLAYRKLAARNKVFLAQFNTKRTLQELVISPDLEQCGSLENICRTGVLEFNRLLESMMTHKGKNTNSFFIESQFLIVKDQIEKTVNEEVSRLDRYNVLLAITSATCPLLGLLGTVWGITHAFADIGKMGQASLNVVAPGIAEALVTTIFGIGVAIPAIIGYNAFVSRNRYYEDEAYNYASILLNRIKIQVFDLLAGKE